MGMFDDIRCEYPLPDGFDGSCARFQTKDTPAQGLILYRITADGRLERRYAEYEWVEDPSRPILRGYSREIPGTERWEEVPLHGDVEFYTSNWSATGPHGTATSDDLPYWSRHYVARFTDGRVAWIRGGLEDVSDVRWLPRAEWDRLHSQPATP